MSPLQYIGASALAVGVAVVPMVALFAAALIAAAFIVANTDEV